MGGDFTVFLTEGMRRWCEKRCHRPGSSLTWYLSAWPWPVHWTEVLMRWLFLLLLVLNVFYYVWHQQEAR